MFNTLKMYRIPLVAVCLSASISVAAVAQDGDKVSDRDITLAIETDLVIDDAVASHRLDVSTRDRIVTLQGSVSNVLARDRAIERARSIKGVRGVVNRISVDAPERSNKELRADVEKALLADPATDSYELNVGASDGKVTLSGTVDSFAEKRLSATVAKGVRGVKQVINNINVNYKTTRSDYEITADIEQHLAMNVWVDATFLDVTVDEGKVSLSGTVGSAAMKDRAERLAWVAGVKGVSAKDIDVNWWAGDRMQRETRYLMPSDKELARAMEAAMMHDPRVFAFNVNASVDNRVATLTGTVDNLKAKRAAGENAENTIGVWRVKNHLRVRPTSIRDDARIATDVHQALSRDPYVERFDVAIDVIGGRVYLSGEVNTSFESRQAEDVATRVNGVIDVVNNISYAHTWARSPDHEIKDDVESQLFWSPFVDSRDITVTVEDGIVTLTGTVEDWSEWRSAQENAFEGNAKDVRNRLKVAGE